MLGDWQRSDIASLWRHCSDFEEWADHPLFHQDHDLGRADLSAVLPPRYSKSNFVSRVQTPRIAQPTKQFCFHRKNMFMIGDNCNRYRNQTSEDLSL